MYTSRWNKLFAAYKPLVHNIVYTSLHVLAILMYVVFVRVVAPQLEMQFKLCTHRSVMVVLVQ